MASFVSLVSLVVAAQQGLLAGQQPTTFRAGIDLVNIGVTVTDNKGNLVTGLTAEDFLVIEDGRPQTVRYFAGGDGSGSPAPEMHLGLLLDVSESMGDDLGFTKTAAIRFLNTLTDAADITVVDFDTHVRVSRYGQSDFARLIERIREQKASGNTALYDAIGMYVDGAAGQNGRKIMLLYTDGGDTRSAMRFSEMLDLLKASDVTVYVIGVLDHQTQASKSAQRPVLQQIAEATGGQVFFPLSVRNLDSVYEKVLAEIRAQYTVGYVSTNDKADGTWRKIELKVNRRDGRDYRLRARKGYYSVYKKP